MLRYRYIASAEAIYCQKLAWGVKQTLLKCFTNLTVCLRDICEQQYYLAPEMHSYFLKCTLCRLQDFIVTMHKTRIKPVLEYISCVDHKFLGGWY